MQRLPAITVGTLLPALLLGLCWQPALAVDPLAIYPDSVQLRGRGASQHLVVMASVNGRQLDVTEETTWEIAPADRLHIDSQGLVQPLGNGPVTVRASWRDRVAQVEVVIADVDVTLPAGFERDVQPILTAHGCNSGACHGKARGQNGFQLSLLGFDSDFDYSALTHQARGRRVFLASPQQSLILQKATATISHGGGVRIEGGGADYRTLLDWIQSGCPRSVSDESPLVGIEVFPPQRICRGGEQQQLVVTASYSDGSRRDVTSRCTYQSNESAVVGVEAGGRVTAGPLAGEATIMARYMGFIGTCRVTIPQVDAPPDEYFDQLPRNNFIDSLVWQRLHELGFSVSEPVDDATYLRRVHLDLIGRLPTPAQTRAFLESTDPRKRAAVVEQLLQQPEYADHWANKWADLLRPNPYRVGIKAVLNYDDWIRQAFRDNRPFDQFARELITAQGSTWRNGAVTLYRDRRSPDEVTTLISQLFLGIRLECAKCHHHPFEKWSQDDYYSLASYFSRVGYKGTGLSPPISGGEEMIVVRDSGGVKHPLTGEPLAPAPLFGEAPPVDDFVDPRAALAQWVTAADNEYFAKAAVNRVWAELMGRGLVDPVDDLRATNPPTNGPLLEALANHFRDQQYDLKSLIRTIVASHVYALSSEPTSGNVADRFYFSRHYRQRLRAEVMLDAVSDITGVPSPFEAMPYGSRANQLWTHRVPSIFLDTFGRPDANQDPPCERTTDSAVTQSLHLMNSREIQRQITDSDGRIAQWMKRDVQDEQLVEELYLWVYSRVPTEDERQVAVEILDDPMRPRQQIAEDLMWALINTPEFQFKN